MKNKENNFAYIDGANLHRGIISFDWQLDYTRFRVWLSDKYEVNRVYIFIGLIPKYKDLCSILLKRINVPITYLNDQRFILQTQKEKTPDEDKTS